jgi:hypothetical protein
MFTNFLLEIRLASQIVLRKPWMTGDSLLAGILNDRYRGNHVRAIAEVTAMLDNLHGVPQMSVLLPYSLATREVQSITFIRNIMRDMEHDPELATILNRMPSRSDMTPSMGPLGSIQNNYSAYDLSKVFFIGRGDAETIARIVGDAGFIGPQRNRGCGQVSGVSITAIPTDNPLFGIVGLRNQENVILRPVPMRLRDQLPADLQFNVNDETWHNPYLPTTPGAVVEECMVPTFAAGEAFHNQQIEDELSGIRAS